MTTRTRACVQGNVQGVGFRPYVYRLAHELGLGGFVRNDSRGVVIEVEGEPTAVDELMRRLGPEAPELASIERVIADPLEPAGMREFEILPSAAEGTPEAHVMPDVATCDPCLRELFDPSDRRFRYPFINCTDCGPRFTIVRGVPYDRARTTMAGFTMCPACLAEYENPLDRRFHAQPNACPACGPQVTLLDPSRSAIAARDRAVRVAAEGLRSGAILAVKGVGGYHLACLARSERAVARLRTRKRREERPFAVMALDLDSAAQLVEIGPPERALLSSRARPIVIAPRRDRALVAHDVAPRSRDLGVMLPYSPLHHLLLHDVGETLVMTSGNLSDEPIAYRDEDAHQRLAEIADLLLVHDRPIETRTDDSVVRATARRSTPLLIRRSRGYVPAATALPVPAPQPLLACGAELKSTFCIANGQRAWVSHHIGDLSNYETLRSFTDGVAHFERLLALKPEVIAYDLHPEYLSSKYALDRADTEAIGVQHHHAHLAACLAEHGELGPAVGAIFDGTGYGTDGTVWGGELLIGDLEGFERAGHLWPVRLPGGERAIREPWRMACAWLVAAGIDSEPRCGIALRDWEAVTGLARRGLSSPETTSVGRLFDAVAALCGLRLRINYEGQAAAELEAACDPAERDFYPLPVADCDGRVVLDARETLRAVVGDLQEGIPSTTVAARFHNAIAAATSCACMLVAGRTGIGTVVLGGGCFQNRRLLESVAADLQRTGLRVLVPERIPANDGGIAYGQAAVAAARLARGEAG